MGTPPHNLIIDVGNSGTKVARYVGEQAVGEIVRLTGEDWEAIDRLVTNHGVKNIIYSTVANVPSAKWIDKWKNQSVRVYALDELPLPFVSVYETMETLGQDRIAAVAGSLGLTAGPRLVVDAGTCVTADLVDANGRYLGGNISPGVRMRLRAMHAFTARLPLVATGTIGAPVGRTTETALRHGGQLGVVYEVEGLFRRLEERFAGLQLLLTGGDAGLLLPDFSIPVLHYPNLVLRGLNQILSNYVNEIY